MNRNEEKLRDVTNTLHIYKHKKNLTKEEKELIHTLTLERAKLLNELNFMM